MHAAGQQLHREATFEELTVQRRHGSNGVQRGQIMAYLDTALANTSRD